MDASLREVSVGRLMKRLGSTPQRPLYRAWQQGPALANHWREHEYPKIARCTCQALLQYAYFRKVPQRARCARRAMEHSQRQASGHGYPSQKRHSH
ncbi:hypothetical protein D8B23_10535 [Verminephrobacter aporrectodeae subsp. tuberculatae]|nr:hypothetical protein [Verminephrobacter aporrectodeae subsp. tuberculatae]